MITVEGIVREVSPLFLKVSLLIAVIFPSVLTDSNELQSQNALAPSDVRSSESVADARDVHPKNAELAIEVTLGIVIEVIPVQP